jgi:hypothetical protein
MGLMIEDGQGRGYGAEVNSDNHLVADTISKPDKVETSFIKGQTYSSVTLHTSTGYLGSSSTYVFYLKNINPTMDFIIDTITVGSNNANLWTLGTKIVGTPVGATVTPLNRKLSDGKTALITSYSGGVAQGNTGQVSGITSMIVTRYLFTSANTSAALTDDGGIILGLNRDIAVQASGLGIVEVTAVGHFRAV